MNDEILLYFDNKLEREQGFISGLGINRFAVGQRPAATAGELIELG